MPSARMITEKMDVQIGQAVRAFRVARGISQTDLGKPLGLTFQQVQKYEKGLNRISTSALIVLCKTMDINPMDIIGPLIGKPTDAGDLIAEVTSLKQQLSDLKANIRSAVK